MTERLILLAIWVLVGLVICGGGCLQIIRMEKIRHQQISRLIGSSHGETLAFILTIVCCGGIILIWPITLVWTYQAWKARREGSRSTKNDQRPR